MSNITLNVSYDLNRLSKDVQTGSLTEQDKSALKAIIEKHRGGTYLGQSGADDLLKEIKDGKIDNADFANALKTIVNGELNSLTAAAGGRKTLETEFTNADLQNILKKATLNSADVEVLEALVNKNSANLGQMEKNAILNDLADGKVNADYKNKLSSLASESATTPAATTAPATGTTSNTDNANPSTDVLWEANGSGAYVGSDNLTETLDGIDGIGDRIEFLQKALSEASAKGDLQAMMDISDQLSKLLKGYEAITKSFSQTTTAAGQSTQASGN